MSRMQSSPFQELVLLNILIHRMIINLKHRVLHQLLKKNRSNDCAFQHVDNEQKSRKINVPVTSAFRQNGWKSV